MKHSLKWPMVAILIIGTLAFEYFNYITTEFGMAALIGAGKVATVGAIAFCLTDIAGLVRVFTPETKLSNEPAEVVMLWVAWIVAAVTNAGLTWFAFLTLMTGRQLGNAVISQVTILEVFPILFALMTLVARLGLIGSVASGLDALKIPTLDMKTLGLKPKTSVKPVATTQRPVSGRPASQPTFRPAEKREVPFLDLFGGDGKDKL